MLCYHILQIRYEGEITDRISVEEIDENLSWLEELPFDRESAKQAATIEDELEKRGGDDRPTRYPDRRDSTTRGGTLITGDDHFERIDGLDVEYY